MLIPCIDLQKGRAVQLIHGRKRALAVDDVMGQLEKFRRYSWLHVIDLDAAMSKGDNSGLVFDIVAAGFAISRARERFCDTKQTKLSSAALR